MGALTLSIELLTVILFLLSDGAQGVPQLFRVQDANLRARVALQALENWPLSAGRELLEFCLNDPSTESSLRTELEVKKRELDVYHRVILVSTTGNTEKCGSNKFMKFSSTLGGFSLAF